MGHPPPDFDRLSSEEEFPPIAAQLREKGLDFDTWNSVGYSKRLRNFPLKRCRAPFPDRSSLPPGRADFQLPVIELRMICNTVPVALVIRKAQVNESDKESDRWREPIPLHQDLSVSRRVPPQ